MQRLDPSFGASVASADAIGTVDRHSSAVQTTWAMLAGQPWVVFVAVCTAALTACIALLALDARQGASMALDQMVDATKVVVFLDPQTSRKDAETIGSRLKAETGVGDLRFRPKEQAFTGISGIRPKLGSTPDEISLPDAWVLSIRAAGETQVAPQSSLTSRAEQLQRSAAALPGVESVQFDALWIGELDRWTKLFVDWTTAGLVTIAAVAFALLFGAFFLAGLALQDRKDDVRGENISFSLTVFAYIGLFFASLAGIVTFLLHALAAFALSQFVTPMPAPMQPWLTAFGHSTTEDTFIIAAELLIAALIANLLAKRPSSVHRQ